MMLFIVHDRGFSSFALNVFSSLDGRESQGAIANSVLPRVFEKWIGQKSSRTRGLEQTLEEDGFLRHWAKT